MKGETIMGKSVAQIVTDRILSRMHEAEKNNQVFRWVKPFSIGSPDRAYSYETMNPYTGINRLILDNTSYLSVRMLNDLNKRQNAPHYQIRKGAKSSIVCFYTVKPVIDKKTGEPMIDEKTGEELQRKVIRYTPVFSREDIIRSDNGEVLPSKFDIKHFNHDEINEKMRQTLDRFNRLFEYYCKKYNIEIQIVKDSSRAYFSHDMKIRIPDMSNFKSVYDWITVLSHELSHSTGVMLGRFDETDHTIDAQIDYAREELVAEISSQIIASELQVIDDSDTPDNAVSYIHSWASILEDRPSEILRASAKAEQSAQFILDCLKELELTEQLEDKNIIDKETEER